MSRTRTLTIAYATQVWKHTATICPARSGSRRLTGVVASQEEEILELRRSKVETRQSVVSLRVHHSVLL